MLEDIGVGLDGSVLIKDSLLAPGGFVTAEFLRAAIKEKRKVVMLLAKEPFAHYQYIMRKLGIALSSHVEQKLVTVLDLFDEQNLPSGATDALQEINKKLQNAVQDSLRHGSPEDVCVIIDSLSELHCLHYDSNKKVWICFLLDLLEWIDDLIDKGVTLITVVHSDIEEDRQWNNLVEHEVEDIITLDPLESGQSNEVTGEMSIFHRALILKHALKATGRLMNARKSFLYKLSENGSRIFTKAQSGVV